MKDNYKVIVETVDDNNVGYTISRNDTNISWKDLTFEERRLIVSMLYQAADYYSVTLNPSDVRQDIKLKYNFDKDIYKGLTVKDFIIELEPIVDEVMRGFSNIKPFTNKYTLGKFCAINQPRYHKTIPDVVKYFSDKYNIK